jgi:hypothetical protein
MARFTVPPPSTARTTGLSRDFWRCKDELRDHDEKNTYCGCVSQMRQCPAPQVVLSMLYRDTVEQAHVLNYRNA